VVFFLLSFSDRASFEDYTEYALNVPMYFIVRHGRWIDMTGIPFRRYLAEGHQGERATMEDWVQHLTTLFPEVRLKKYLEIRCIDQLPAELMLSVPALCKGIFYENDSLWAAWDLVKKWSWEERVSAYYDSTSASARRTSARDFPTRPCQRTAAHLVGRTATSQSV